jgi:sugar phosphate isomerase/epimerase
MVPVAVQLYTLREELKRGFVGVLREVAEIGYAGVEFAGYGGLSAADLKAALDEFGLKAAGSHVALAQLESELDQVIEYNLAIGNRNIVCPWLPEERRNNYGKLAESLNAIGRKLKENGLQLFYHNHAFEFDRFEGRHGLDILFAETDPDLVKAELDVYWVKRGGVDPVAYLKGLGGRCPLVHLKDMAAGPEQRFAPVGTGTIDFEALFEVADDTAEWYIVEQDLTYGKPALEEIRLSLQNLRTLGKV